MAGSIKKNMVVNTFGALVYLGCQWLMTVVVVRLSNDFADAGDLSLAMAVGNIFLPIALYKIRSFQVSDLSSEYSSRQYIGLRIVTIGFALLVCSVYALLTCPKSSFTMIMVYCLYKAIEAFVDVMHGIDQRAGEMKYCGYSMALRGVLSIAAFVLSLCLNCDLQVALFAMIVVSMPIAFLDVIWASRFDSVKPAFSAVNFVALGMRCLPAVVGVVLCALVTSFSRQYLALSLGNDVLGIYSSVCAPAAIIQACAYNVYSPLLGIFAKAYYDKSEALFRRMLIECLLAIAACAVVLLLVCAIFGDGLLFLIFGKSILPYTYLLYGAMISAILTSLIGLFADLLIVRRRIAWNLLGNAASFVAVVPITVFAVGAFEANGVSVAIAASYAIGCLAMLPAMLSGGERDNSSF